jgi:CDP-paratose 2-epimerase
MIGSHVASHYWDESHDVVVMDNFERSELLGYKVSDQRKYYNRDRLTDKGIQCLPLDVSKIEDWQYLSGHYGPFDAIVHCAAQCGVPTSIADPVRDYEINATGTLYALEAARDWGARLVYASTNKVYPIHENAADRPWMGQVWSMDNEKNRWRWHKSGMNQFGWTKEAMSTAHGTRTPYGASKYFGDLLCQEWAGMYGVPTGVFRMSCIYGEHQMGFEEQGWATWFAIALEKDLPLTIYGDGFQVRDMLHVSDVVRAYDAFIQSDLKHGVWNLGGGPENAVSLHECMQLLKKLRGKDFAKVEYKGWRPSDQKVYTSDIRPLDQDLNWKPIVSVEEGMERVVEWVKKVSDVF